jgi:mono/diheme cytochrome c family protein
MKRLIIAPFFFAFVVVAVLYLTRAIGMPAGTLPDHSFDLVNGERIFNAGGCASCHSSGAKDAEVPELGGGLAMDTDFGIFHAPNISPHKSNGIGSWTMLEFASAMLKGVSPEGQHLYPSFPYTSYTRMQITDVMDLKSYLDTLPPVAKINLPHELKFPWNIRDGIGLWKVLNLNSDPIIDVPTGNNKLLLGRYLVEGPGHCGECHTPRNWSGGLNTKDWLAGAPNPEGEGKVPNITPGAETLGQWSEKDIAYYLKSGFTPDYDTVGSSMVEVQENMSKLSDEDRKAIAAYLKAVPAITN